MKKPIASLALGPLTALAMAGLVAYQLTGSDRVLDGRAVWIMSACAAGMLSATLVCGLIAEFLGRRMGLLLRVALVTLLSAIIALGVALSILIVPHWMSSYAIYTPLWRWRPVMTPLMGIPNGIGLAGMFLLPLLGLPGLILSMVPGFVLALGSTEKVRAGSQPKTE